eukprot:c18422_g2_i1.p1 GENE.c18422_g2_i1~~c18422_g2_i1.p1  ORF type:complete len:155 (+),score=50.48 c18422_g2_i1:1-465(+)
MTMTWVLFVDISELTANPPESRQKYDGDTTRWGRCHEKNNYPSRMDFISTNHNYNQRTGVLPPRDRWKMLNESYDVLVPICHLQNFVGRKTDRYNLNRRGMEIFDRPDAFSVHFSCGEFKPSCNRSKRARKLPPCARDMFDQWYKMLDIYYQPT